MSNYALHTMFGKDTENEMKEIIDKVHTAFPQMIGKPNEPPHLTILYGPTLVDGESEMKVYDKHAVAALYPGIPIVDDVDLQFVGVSHFKRDVGYIIKLEFISDALTELTCALRLKYPQVNESYLAAHKTDNDMSRAFPPSRWLHVTIGTVRDVADVPAVEEYVRNLAIVDNSTLLSHVEVHVDRFTMVSAVTDTYIDIPDKGFDGDSESNGDNE